MLDWILVHPAANLEARQVGVNIGCLETKIICNGRVASDAHQAVPEMQT